MGNVDRRLLQAALFVIRNSDLTETSARKNLYPARKKELTG